MEPIPRMARHLRILHLESSRNMSDSTLQSILLDNPLIYLEEFFVMGSGNRLSSKTVVRLTSVCQRLKWVGDLRDWNINSTDRNSILPKLLQREGWDSSKSEPKDDINSFGVMFAENTQQHGLSIADS